MTTDPKNGIDEARPVVNLFMADRSAGNLAATICLGLEEEGIPWDCRPLADERGLTGLAKQAADRSKLNVGLAMDDDTIVLHHRDLPLDKPLFTLTGEQLDVSNLRRLGANAARLVKGNPLLLDTMVDDDAPTLADVKNAPPIPKADDVDPDQVADLVVRVLTALGLGQQDKDM